MPIGDEEQRTRRREFRSLFALSRYVRELGLEIEVWSEEGATIRLPFAERLTNDGRDYHGGVIGALVDTAGAAAVWAGHDFDKGLRASTVSMTVNYCGRGRGDLVARARCVRRGRDLSFTEVRVEDDAETLVATGTLVYRIVP